MLTVVLDLIAVAGPSIAVPVVALVTGAVVGVAGVLAGLWQNNQRIKADEKLQTQRRETDEKLDELRREADEKLNELRRQHEKDLAVRGRLHQDRVAAYRDFISANRTLERAHRPLRVAWLKRRARKIIDADPERDKDMDEVERTARRDMKAAQDRVADALDMLVLVASKPVREAAAAMLSGVEAQSTALTNMLVDTPAEIEAGRMAYQELTEGVSSSREELRQRIRDELQLDA